MFLCFYSGIFTLTSVRFQTFAYNSRTLWSCFIKFRQQFEITELHVCTKFRGKPPRGFGVKSGLIQKRPKYGKKYFTHLYVLGYPFIPINPLFVARRFCFLFFLRKSLLLNHKTSNSNVCLKLLSCKRDFVNQNFFGRLPRDPPKNSMF